MITQLLLNPQLTPPGIPSRLEQYSLQKRTCAIGIHLPMSVDLRVLCRGTGAHTFSRKINKKVRMVPRPHCPVILLHMLKIQQK